MECTQRSDFRLGLGLLASTLIHATLAIVWGQLIETPSSKQTPSTPKAQQFKLENLSNSQIQKIRQAGVRGGSKDGFNAPVPQTQKSAKVKRSETQAKSGQNDISLQDLSPRPQRAAHSNQQVRPQTNSSNRDAGDLRVSAQEVTAQRIARQQRSIQGEVLRELSASTRAREVIETTGFNLQFDPPEGIPQDELNSVEKIFYSFQKRTFTSYVTTFISNYHQMSLQSSKLKRSLQTQSHDLLGRVEFNDKGETASIRIMEGSPIKEVQNLFEKTLKDLKLPNPPKDLLREDGRFVIYYRLKIND
jgi:hypothetical protein